MDAEAETRELKAGEVAVRPAAEGDLEAVNDIYNEYIVNAHFTFDIEPWTIDARREWFSHYALEGSHRLFVATAKEAVIGFASSSRFRPKRGYDTTVETSIYLAPEATGLGAGTKLYEALFKSLRDQDLHRAYAGVTMPNPASVALHERFGFKRVALFTEQGRKFDKYWDVAWFEKPLPATD